MEANGIFLPWTTYYMRWLPKIAKCHECYGSWGFDENFESFPEALTMVIESFAQRGMRDEGWEWEEVIEIWWFKVQVSTKEKRCRVRNEERDIWEGCEAAWAIKSIK